MVSKKIVILITGTPGTGKTIIAKLLSERLNAEYLSLNDLAFKYNFIESYDKDRDTWVIKEKELSAFVKEKILKSEKNIVIDSHMGEILDPKIIDYIIILRTRPKVLKERLSERNWKESKVDENVQAEILGIVTYNILQHFPKERIFEIDTSDKSPNEVVEIIEKIIKHEKSFKKYLVGKIDCLDEEAISKFFD